MTYKLRRTSDSNFDLENDSGTVIASFTPPVTTPDDIIDAILEDMGLGEPQKQVFRVLFKRDWELVDDR